MPGISALSKIQMGVEATAGGTTDAPTTIWRGMGVLKDNLVMVFPAERVGILGGTTRSYIPKKGGEITLEGLVTFEQLPYMLNAGVYGTTPTTDASSAQIWTWTVQSVSTDPISSSDLFTLVIEGGDNQQAEIMRYCFVKEITLSGKAGEGVEGSHVLEGRTVTTTTFTSALSIPTVYPVLTSLGSLYIDPSTDTIGTTAVSQTLYDFSLKYTTGWRSVDMKDNRLDFSFVKRIDDEIVLEVTFEHNDSAVTEKAAWRNQTERAIRLEFKGDALSTTDAGAPYDTKALIIDLWGKWEMFDVLSEQDGNNMVKGTFRAKYSELASNKARFIVVNELASLP
jgi:hypothetical protein